jgi:hypothetical protein
MIYEAIAQNREIFKVLYSTIIVLACLIIFIKSNRLFKISHHQGIRYFRNAFFFYGLAFLSRYFIVFLYPSLMKVVFEFFLIMAGFSLFYSLLWKKFETPKGSFSSLFNLRMIIFYLFAILLVGFDFLWNTYNFLFFSQIILFLFISIVSYVNYKNKRRHKFLKLYFIVMILNLLAWTLNFIAAIFFNWRLRWTVNVYILNVVIFLVFLYGVLKFTKKSKIL